MKWLAEPRANLRNRAWYLRLPLCIYLAYVGWNQFQRSRNYRHHS